MKGSIAPRIECAQGLRYADHRSIRDRTGAPIRDRWAAGQRHGHGGWARRVPAAGRAHAIGDPCIAPDAGGTGVRSLIPEPRVRSGMGIPYQCRGGRVGNNLVDTF